MKLCTNLQHLDQDRACSYQVIWDLCSLQFHPMSGFSKEYNFLLVLLPRKMDIITKCFLFSFTRRTQPDKCHFNNSKMKYLFIFSQTTVFVLWRVFFNLMASAGLYSNIYITILSLINYLCALETNLRLLNT